MPFAHERLDVYSLALDFIALADHVVEQLPRGRGHLADQLGRASTSIVLNLAEGASKFSKPDKRRYHLIAVGSTTECAAIGSGSGKTEILLRMRSTPPAADPHSRNPEYGDGVATTSGRTTSAASPNSRKSPRSILQKGS